jgi:hypothetical protein
MQLLSSALHCTLGHSHLRDALQEGIVEAVACLRIPWAKACGVFSSFFIFDWWFPLLFLVINCTNFRRKSPMEYQL